MRSQLAATACALAVALGASACGGANATTTTPTTRATQAAKVLDARAVTQALAAAGLPVHLTVVYTAATDPNSLLGRPGGYLSKAAFSDSRLTPDPGLERGDLDRGGSVEVFAHAADAAARAAHIQAVLRASAILGAEWDYVKGGILVRVTGKLTPAQAQGYQRAVAGL